MSWQAWFTLAVVVATVVLLSRDLLPPSGTMLGAAIALMVARVLTPEQALAGFSNTAVVTVAAIYVLSRAVEKTGLLRPLVAWVLGQGVGRRRTLARLGAPLASRAFFNNTPIVATLLPQVTGWAEQRGQSPSRYLIPLSFMTILGGTVTLLGTSTNLIVSGLLHASGAAPIGMFELTRIGVPVALLGVALVVLLAPVVLPDRRPARRDVLDNAREFVVSMDVTAGGQLDGQTVEGGGLRHLQGVFLVEVDRGGQLIAPVAPTTVLRGGDRLTFVGRVDQIVDLQGKRGLVSAEQRHIAQFDSARHTFLEVVVGAASPLLGRTLAEAEFRERYQAAVVAIHRAGQRVGEKLGQVRLKVGDTLLLLADPGFAERWRDRNDFLVVSRLGGAPPSSSRKAGIVAAITIAIVVLNALRLLPLLEAALLGAIALVALGVLSPREARSAVDLDVIVMIAASFALSAAIQRSGLGARIADLLVLGLGGFGPTGVLLGILLAAVALNTIVTNNATAVLVFPIAMSAAAALAVNPRPFALAVAVISSASFLSPIGYQTNTMVYGPGGYRFGDYARLGAPLTALVLLVVLVAVRVAWPF
jgi:di/tricarboxylate transporter